MTNITHNIDVAKISISIELLKKYVQDSSIEPLLSALEKLKQEPDSEAHFEQLSKEFNALGIIQGAVLTYAPYLSVLLSNDLFRDY